MAVACRVIRRRCPRPVRRRRNPGQRLQRPVGNPPVALDEVRLKTFFPRILDSVILAKSLVGTIEKRIERMIKSKIKKVRRSFRSKVSRLSLMLVLLADREIPTRVLPQLLPRLSTPCPRQPLRRRVAVVRRRRGSRRSWDRIKQAQYPTSFARRRDNLGFRRSLPADRASPPRRGLFHPLRSQPQVLPDRAHTATRPVMEEPQ